MDFSRWTREKSIIAPSVKKYRVYTPIGGEKEELYTGRKKNPLRHLVSKSIVYIPL